ncbi:hypothetical protein MASR1M90_01030 [Desulfovibrionales bacterium]
MGTVYSNITLKGPQPRDVIQELGSQGRSAFVVVSENGLTTVYEMDSDEGESRLLQELAEDLSGCFGCPALAVRIAEENALCYWLYDDGQLVDNSAPFASPQQPAGTGATQRSRSNSELLARYFNTNASAEEIIDILAHPGHENGETLAVDRHLSLVELLELPLCSVGFSFCDLDSGEFPEDVDEEDVLSVNIE